VRRDANHDLPWNVAAPLNRAQEAGHRAIREVGDWGVRLRAWRLAWRFLFVSHGKEYTGWRCRKSQPWRTAPERAAHGCANRAILAALEVPVCQGDDHARPVRPHGRRRPLSWGILHGGGFPDGKLDESIPRGPLGWPIWGRAFPPDPPPHWPERQSSTRPNETNPSVLVHS